MTRVKRPSDVAAIVTLLAIDGTATLVLLPRAVASRVLAPVERLVTATVDEDVDLWSRSPPCVDSPRDAREALDLEALLLPLLTRFAGKVKRSQPGIDGALIRFWPKLMVAHGPRSCQAPRCCAILAAIDGAIVAVQQYCQH